MLFKYLQLMFISGLISSLFSQEVNDTQSKTESWYTYWGIGLSSSSYPSIIEKEINYLQRQDNASHQPLSLDILGFYGHFNPHTLVGVIINGVADRYTVKKQWMQVNQYLFAASTIHFLGENFGNGLFIRVDAGIASVIQSYEKVSLRRGSGFGLLSGVGWSFDLQGTKDIN